MSADAAAARAVGVEGAVGAVGVGRAESAGGAVEFRAGWFYFIFAASGFSGLVYESVWTRYLKLFLGHAALAQALVLAIFLFGLAAGSAAASRFSRRMPRPLLAYAAIEVVVALAAIWFHEIYIVATGWALDTVAPALIGGGAGAGQVEALKWGLGAALILPQSLLLGATFPLMSAGLVRLRPQRPGGIVAMLYFSNSFGAALGVVASGFFFIPAVGLPGAVTIAGFINVAVAAAIWVMDRRRDPAPPLEEAAEESPLAAAPTDRRRLTALVLVAAALTGFASLVYEIVWVRMLSLLLGSSTHSFELMLSAFIMGLALGGLAVRRRTDRAADPLAFLGWVQIAMAALALASLLLYPALFHLLAKTMQILPRTDAGYAGLLGFSFLLANAMMLPTTICAGMTLPLLTRKLMSSGGERAVGAVYAANTFGAIAAVCVAGNFLMPALGIKGAFIVGALTDLALGLALFAFAAPKILRLAAPVALASALLGATANMNPLMLSSGVFRNGRFDLESLAEIRRVVSHRDGRTASVTVTENIPRKRDGKDGDEAGESDPGSLSPESTPLPDLEESDAPLLTRSILTNGKSDASLYQTALSEDEEPPMTGDEMTMVLSGLLPLLANPDARLAANIGFGSGLTTRALLLSPNIERVDTVEIEEMMPRGARELGPRVADVFSDSRSRVIAADAKTFFAAAPDKYDIVVSEPSNPWVGGIAGLFTREFYRRARGALAEGGVFVQWMHLYESNPLIFASVAGALAEEFSDYRMYLSGVGDVIFVATAEGKAPALRGDIFRDEAAADFFRRYRLRRAADAEFLFLGDRARMEPYFASFQVPANSDYYPYLENNAPQAFFQKGFYVLGELPQLPIPLREAALGVAPPAEGFALSPVSNLLRLASEARKLADEMENPDGGFARLLAGLREAECEGEERTKFLEKTTGVLLRMMPYWSGAEMARAWERMEEIQCVADLLADKTPEAGGYLRFWRANTLRDNEEVARTAAEIAPFTDYRLATGQVVLLAVMTARYSMGHWAEVLRLASLMPPIADPISLHAARLLAANAAENMRKSAANQEG